MYYSATLFKEIGFNQPTAVGLIVSGTNFLFTLFALKYIDIIGRRRILLWSMPGMIFGLVLASVAFHCTPCFIPFLLTDETKRVGDPVMTRNTGNVLVDGTHYSRGWSGVVLFSMITFVASYATGLGNVPWQQGELFSLEGVADGSSCGDALLIFTPFPMCIQCAASEPPLLPPPTGQ